MDEQQQKSLELVGRSIALFVMEMVLDVPASEGQGAEKPIEVMTLSLSNLTGISPKEILEGCITPMMEQMRDQISMIRSRRDTDSGQGSGDGGSTPESNG